MMEYLRIKKAFKRLVKHKHQNIVVLSKETLRFLKTKYKEELSTYCLENNIKQTFNPITGFYEFELEEQE